MAYSPEQYAAAGQFIQQNLGNPELIASTARSFNLSVDDLLKASQTVDPNLTAQDVTGYFQRSGIDYAQPSPLSTVEASPVQQQAQAYQPQGALPVSTGATGTSATGALTTINNADAYRYTADPNAGQYVFDPLTGKHKLLSADQVYNNVEIPTFTDRTVYQGGGEDTGTFESASQQLAAWKAEQDRRAALTPAQRAIEDARYTENLEGGNETRYNTVIVGGKDYTVTGDGSTLVRLSDNQTGLGAKQTRYDILDPATGKITQEIGVKGPGLLKSFLTNPVTGLILGLALPGVGSAIGSALGATGAAAGALGSGVLNFGLQVAAGADPIDALKGAVLSAGAGFAGAQVSSMLPAELAAAGKNAVTQLITTGKLDPAALATSVGTSFATDALAAETGLDKATAAKLVNAGVKAIQGNELGALTSLFQVGLQNDLLGTGIKPQSSQDRAAFLEANASPLGLSALSPNPTEDEFIDLQNRTNTANQLLNDYAASGSDISRDSALSRLASLGISSTKANELLTNIDRAGEQRRVAVDVMGRYEKIDPEFGTPQLERGTAIQELVAAGYSSERANDLLNDIDAKNASKVENKLNVQAAFNDFLSGSGTQDQLRSAMLLAGYTDAQINNLVTRGNAIIEGGKLTAGEQAQERAANLPDIRAEIAGKSNFNDAYAVAKEKLGTGGVFTWGGKSYTVTAPTEVAGLRPETKTPDTASYGAPYVAPNGMHNRAAFIQAGGGTSDADYAKYVQAVNAVVSQGKSGTLIAPSSVNSTGKELPSTTGPVTMEKPRVDSVLGSVAAQGVASFGANSIAGGLSALGFTDAGAAVLNKANQIANAATAAEGADITRGKADINAAIKKVGESSGIKDFAANIGNLASTAFNNPKAFGATVGSEVVEELLQLATVKFPASFLVKETVASALENGGAAYNTEYESQITKGASKEAAHQAAQKAAGTAAGVTVGLAGAAAGLSKAAGKVLGSQADEVPTSGVGQVGKTTLKESAQETVEEGSIAGAIDLALGRPVDAANMLTNMTGGALYGGPTSGTMQATKLDTLDRTASTSIGSGLDAALIGASIKSGADVSATVSQSITTASNAGVDTSAAIDTTVRGALDAGADTTVVVDSAVKSGLDAGMSTGTVVSSTVGSALSTGADSTVVIDSTLSAVAQAGGDVSQAAGSAVKASLGAGANANETIIAATSSAIKNGGDAGPAVTTVIAGAVQGGASLSDASASSVATAIVGGANADTVIKAVTDSNSGVSVKADTSNNVTTVVASDATSNTKVVMDSNSQSVVTTTTDTNTGTTTQTTMQGNTTITTTTDQNTGISTTTKVDPNTTTNTTTDTNTGITTQVTTNTNTNTTTTVVTDATTGRVINTDTVVGGQGNDVITKPPVITTPPPVPPEPPPVPPIPPEPPPVPPEPPPVPPPEPPPKPPKPPEPPPKPPVGGVPASLLATGASGELGRLLGQMLKSGPAGKQLDPLAAMKQRIEDMNAIDPALAAVMSQRLGLPQPEPERPSYTYGQETSIDDILGLSNREYAEGGYVEPLKAAGGAMNPQFMFRAGGSREDFRHGKHVAGEGDGQSDDIPAWLADSEFVLPADVVAALGNGSTKAGTDKLYEMMYAIRKRARSTGPKDLPPPAYKSPLDYIKKSAKR